MKAKRFGLRFGLAGVNMMQRAGSKNVAFRIVLGVTLTFLLAGLLL